MRPTILLLLALSANAADVTGTWTGYPGHMVFKQEGNKITGTAGPNRNEQLPIENGTIDGDHVTFNVGQYKFDLHVQGDTIQGDLAGDHDPMKVLLKRAAAVEGAASFDVASVRRSDPTPPVRSNSRFEPGRLTCENIRLKDLISRAYDVKKYQIVGPDWLDSETYNIIATMPPDTSVERVQLMLQSLLTSRFQLSLHRETKEQPVYALVIGKAGLKLQEIPLSRGGTKSTPGKIEAHSQNMARFTSLLSNFIDRPVIDETGLHGFYDFNLEWSPASKTDPDGPSIYTAVQEQLGLKLEPRKAPIEMLIIDRAEKIPTEN